MDKYQVAYKIDELKQEHNDLIMKEIEGKVKEYTEVFVSEINTSERLQVERLLRTLAIDVRILSEQLLK